MKLPILSFALAAATLSAASLPPNRTHIEGDYVEARTADVYTGPCYANSEVNLVGNLAVFGWHVHDGAWQGVNLKGLSVAGVVKASATLGDVNADAYPVTAVLIIDEKATPEQRLALKSFAQKMGGDLLNNIVDVQTQPIEFAYEGESIHSRKVKFNAGALARIETRALENQDNHCSNEITWYPPLTHVDHAMPAYALAHSFTGKALGTTWSSPEKRSAFVGQFHYSE